MRESVYVCERHKARENENTTRKSGSVFLKTCKSLLAIFIPSVADFEQHLPAYHLRRAESKLVIFHSNFFILT